MRKSVSGMNILSVDIGEKNLGWTFAKLRFVEISGNRYINFPTSEFISGVYDLEVDHRFSIVLSRINGINKFLQNLVRDMKITKFDKFIVERQVMRNNIAMELMYGILGVMTRYIDDCKDIVIFDPKLKFTEIGQQYDTKNKNHKKQSIMNMNKFISTELSPSFITISEIVKHEKKKDDIADSFNQLIIQLRIWKFINFDLRGIYNK